ncbi:mitochondrial sodium/calcium exchanger protein isoform X2 [Drosophila rhopaloa]|uniref:Sodium/potassium/calcium exchanger 6, mitochondrial n=1 Tax=Drosophila rhopaloa TaxID=1041015 RepID=A0A6P4FM31_DRORH|nr:mitochondrial sodium/calcium exchanger protein isoform X2 [Drosophila rhopaloa]
MNRETYEPNEMDAEFESFWDKVSCFAANTFPFEERCDFVMKAKDCNRSTNVLPYMRILACHLKCINEFEQLIYITLFVALCFQILVLLIYVCNNYSIQLCTFSYSPALKAVSKFLHMNEHVAGVTLLAFGNSSADLFSNLASVGSNVPVFANALAAALFVSMVSGGLVCYMSPFKMNAYESVRDILFLIFGSSLLQYFLSTDNRVTEPELIVMFLVYVSYLFVNVADVYLIRRALNATNAQIDAIMEEELTPERRRQLSMLEKDQAAYSRNAEVEIFERSSSGPNINKIRYTTMRMARNTRVSVNQKKTRNVRHNQTLGKNWGLFKEFFLALRPLSCKKWQKANMIERALMLTQIPCVLLCSIYIPLVDYELDKHGWNKLLNCFQVMFNPACTIIVIKALISSNGNTLWYVAIGDEYVYGLYSLPFTMPIALFMFIQSRTDMPPFYHSMFTVMNLTGSMFMIFACATEIDKVLEVIGHLMDVEDDFMGATVKACTGSLGPLIANIAMALHGYPKMAYASAIGGPFFTVVLSSSTVLHVRNLFGYKVTLLSQTGNYGGNAFIFLNIGLFSALLWSTTLGFFARRSMGIFCVVFYCIYLTFAILIHGKVIHSFSVDMPLQAAFGDI